MRLTSGDPAGGPSVALSPHVRLDPVGAAACCGGARGSAVKSASPCAMPRDISADGH